MAGNSCRRRGRRNAYRAHTAHRLGEGLRVALRRPGVPVGPADPAVRLLERHEEADNEAEYQAVIDSLQWLLQSKYKTEKVVWRLDSMLVVEQLNRHWKIKEPRLQQLANEAWQLLAKLTQNHTFVYVPRAENARADALANQAMDQAK